MMAAASSECSSGCQSGWTTYLDDDDHHSCGTARSLHGKATQRQQPYYYFSSEEDDLSMISDASSGPQRSAGNDDVVEGGAASNAAAEGRGRRVDASARRQSRKAASALLEDTASSPAFIGYSKATSLPGEANGYGDGPVMEIGDADDFSCAFSATTGFKVRASSPSLHGTALDGYLQMQYSPAAAKPTMPARQVFRGVGETKRW